MTKAAPSATHTPGDDALAALAALRRTGAPEQDPVRWHHLERLAQRLSGAPPKLQTWLAQRLQQAVADHSQRCQLLATPERPALASPGLQPLLELNQHLQSLASPGLPQHTRLSASGNPAAPQIRMRSLNRFQDTWARVRADQQLHQALGRSPEQAGPLNPHKLVLRSLTLLRDLSPDYTRRLMVQWEDLLWLEQAQPAPSSRDNKPARRARAKKSSPPNTA